MANKQVQKLVLTASCLKLYAEQMVAISPEDTTKRTLQERCSKMKLLDYIKVTIKAILFLTCFGLFLSNTIIIYSSKLDNDISDTNAEIELMSEQLKNLEISQTKINRELNLMKMEQNTVMFNASCYELWDLGERENGTFMIQPSLDGLPFEVECQFTDYDSITVINHRQSQSGQTAPPGAEGGCEPRGCFADKITYGLDKSQLEALIRISSDCEQEITHHCFTNALSTYAFWLDRHGREVTYWNGDKQINETGCTCKETQTCQKQEDFNAERECNCDDKRANLTDYGVLTSKTQLPVTQLNYGGSQEIFSWIEYKLGAFKCNGRNERPFPSEIRSTGFEFMLATNSSGDVIIQKNNPLLFDHVIYDRTFDFYDTLEDGVFIAPVDGLYRFEIQLLLSKYRIEQFETFYLTYR